MKSSVVGVQNHGDPPKQAESVYRNDLSSAPDPSPAISIEDPRKLLHELQVLQAELEMQNEELRLANWHLTEKEESYQTLFRHAGEGIFTMAPDGTLIEANHAIAALHGYPIEAMQGLHLRDFVSPGCAVLAADVILRVLAGESLTFEAEHIHRDGHAFTVEVSASLVHVGGKPVILCFNRDITERKRAELELRGSHSLLERAEKMARFGHWELNLERQRIRVSTGAKRIYGLMHTEWTLAEAQGFVLPGTENWRMPPSGT